MNAYIVERETEGRKWFDLHTISSIPTDSATKGMDTDNLIPQWAKDNPQVRVAQVELVEVLWKK
uniref:Uncharacterized protein n=1 Tax=viral metagenome TaxID=1070528 RepID=A0A6M3LSX7_9ZZZZ